MRLLVRIYDPEGPTIPKYFFDFDGHDPDDTGEELADALEARKAAIELLGQVLDDDPLYPLQGHWTVNVTDEQHRTLYTVSVVVNAGPTPETPDGRHG